MPDLSAILSQLVDSIRAAEAAAAGLQEATTMEPAFADNTVAAADNAARPAPDPTPGPVPDPVPEPTPVPAPSASDALSLLRQAAAILEQL